MLFIKRIVSTRTSSFATRRVIARSRRWLRGAFELKSGTDYEGAVARIRVGVQLRGANVWILVCAAFLASVGLDVSSAAVIIGAMLISPLMGPILGVGLGVAIHDRGLLLSALRNFAVAVLASMAASTLYFLITPLGTPTPELIARTTPTLLDVGVAFFGGLAGIIAGSRREVTTAIPGVAIATALMPPLCTAGFGIATGRWSFLFGAFYLFFINAVFISLSTYLIARILRFPQVGYLDPAVKRRVDRWIFVFVLVAMIPSTIIFYQVIGDLRMRQAVERFVSREVETPRREALNWSRVQGDSLSLLKIYLVGDPISPERIDSLANILPRYGLGDMGLDVVQANLPKEEQEKLAPEDLLSVLQSAEIRQRLGDSSLQLLEGSVQRRDTAVPGRDSIPAGAIASELRVLIPELADIAFAADLRSGTDAAGDTATTSTRAADTVGMSEGKEPVPAFLLRFNPGTPAATRRRLVERIELFLQERIGRDSVAVMELAAAR